MSTTGEGNAELIQLHSKDSKPRIKDAFVRLYYGVSHLPTTQEFNQGKGIDTLKKFIAALGGNPSEIKSTKEKVADIDKLLLQKATLALDHVVSTMTPHEIEEIAKIKAARKAATAQDERLIEDQKKHQVVQTAKKQLAKNATSSILKDIKSKLPPEDYRTYFGNLEVNADVPEVQLTNKP